MSSFALITGASKGIGKSFALQLAQKKIPVLLLARSEDELKILAEHIRITYKVPCEYLALDLSLPNATQQVFDWCQQQRYAVSILLNNAGYGLWGSFADLSLESQLNMLQLNMQTMVQLSHLFLPELTTHAQAYILNVASTAAYQAVPTLSLYAASKSFVLSFSRGLAHELKDSTVSVTCLCPGPVNTYFTERAGMSKSIQATAERFGMAPDEVAKAGLQAMFHKRREIVPGVMNKITAFFVAFSPKALVEKVAASLYKQG